MKKCGLIALCAVCTFAFMCYSVFAEEKHNYIGGSIGGELWYADWESENQWSIEGVDIDYDIKPSLIYGYSASVNYTKRKKLFTGIILDYFTSKMEEELNSEAFEGDEDDLGAYREIKAKIDQRIGENDYFHLQVMYAKFEGDITVKEGGTALNVPTGTSWELDTKWFKADAMYLFGGVVGIGLRYLSYEKPETTSLFHATGEAEGSLVEGDLISGEVVNTKFESYNLLFGVWDPSYIGIPTDSWFFIDIRHFEKNNHPKMQML